MWNTFLTYRVWLTPIILLLGFLYLPQLGNTWLAIKFAVLFGFAAAFAMTSPAHDNFPSEKIRRAISVLSWILGVVLFLFLLWNKDNATSFEIVTLMVIGIMTFTRMSERFWRRTAGGEAKEEHGRAPIWH